MTIFLIGVLVGVALLLLAYNAFISYKHDKEITLLINTQRLLILEVNKVYHISKTTMDACETFVDALKDSAQQFKYGPPQSPLTDNFDDIRETFENGIKEIEEDDEDDWKTK